MSFKSITPENNTSIFNLIYAMSETKYEPSLPSFPHLHNYTELLYVAKGSGKLAAYDKLYSIKEGDLVILDNGTIHTELGNNNESSQTFFYYSIGLKDYRFNNITAKNFIFNSNAYKRTLSA